MYTTIQVVCEKTFSTTLVTLSFIIPTYLLILICIYCVYTLYPPITLHNIHFYITNMLYCCSEIAINVN